MKKKLLRLQWGLRLGKQQLSLACDVSPNAVVDYIGRAERAGLGWPLSNNIDDASLEALLFLSEAPWRTHVHPMPSSEKVHQGLL